MSVRIARRLPWALLSIFLLHAHAGCRRESESTAAREDKLVVFAAASLRGVFLGIGEEFERTHPGVDVIFNFAGTQDLRTQIEQGAEADVFASANQQHLAALIRAGHAASSVVFAINQPVVAVSEDAASRIRTFADLPSADRIVIGVPEVPIGRYTLQILDRATKELGGNFRTRVEAKVVSKELNVRQIVSKITLGEADAALVYRTDVPSADAKVRVVPIPAAMNVVAEYPMASISYNKHPALAKAWVEFVTSTFGRTALERAGFDVP